VSATRTSSFLDEGRESDVENMGMASIISVGVVVSSCEGCYETVKDHKITKYIYSKAKVARIATRGIAMQTFRDNQVH
jgi:hypothetical protein